jgi:hypothetical protein
MSAKKGEPERESLRDASGQQEVSDERLEVLPTDDDDRVSDVIGPDRDDLDLKDDGALNFTWNDEETDNQGGPIDFHEAGRQAQAQIIADETDLTTTPHSLAEERGATPDIEPSFTDQTLISDPEAASGGPDDISDPASDLDETYTPPIDPVITVRDSGEVAVLGGFSTDSSGQITPQRSSDGQIGDEAIADAVRAALKLDAATTDLRIAVTALEGVVRLRGTVADLDDADNAESVAAGVEGVLEVQEQLDVTNA